MPRKPLPRVIEMQHMLTPKTERGEPPSRLGLLLLLGPVRARHADNLEAHDAPGQVTTAVGAAYTGVDARQMHQVLILSVGRHGQRRGRSGMVVVLERGGGVAVDAAEGDLSGRGLDGRDAVSLGSLGRLDFELCALEEELVALEVRPVGVSPGTASDVVDVARVAYGQDERGRLHVVELLHVPGKDVHHGVRDAGQDNALDVALLDSPRDLLLQPVRELIVGEVANRDKGTIDHGQGVLIRD